MSVPEKTPRGAQRTTPLGVLRSLAETDAADPASTNAGAAPEGSGLYRLLVDSVQDYAIFAMDAEGRVLTWNAGAQRLKGYLPEEIIGRSFSAFYPPEDLEAGKPFRALEVAAREGRLEDEGWRVRKDGSRFWANVLITALRDDAGRLVGFAKVTRDLTERRRADVALRQSEERFRLLVQGVRDYAIFVLDPGGRIASWNEGAQRIKGYSADEIIGRHFSIFYPPEDVAAEKPARELEIATRDGTYEEEGWRLRKDGSRFWASVVITALRGDRGDMYGFAKVTRDLTERRAAHERAIEDARRVTEAQTESRTKSEFLTTLSHELRTPINATLGYADLLEIELTGPLTERQRDYLARIQLSQRHLLQMVTDLLDYSRVAAGRLEYDLAAVPVQPMVAEVMSMIEPQAVAKGLVVDCGACPADVVAWTDRAKAEQIVLNLLSNAVKFTPAGGHISVGCDVAGDRVVVTVADTGPGISAEQQGGIFQPFVQLGRSLTSGHEGTGLGLAISRDLARAMGGDLTVQSEPGAGATFALTLPRAEVGEVGEA